MKRKLQPKPKYDVDAVRERLEEKSALRRITGNLEFQMRSAEAMAASGSAPHVGHVHAWMKRAGILPRELWGLSPARAIFQYALTVDPARGAGWLRDAGLVSPEGHLPGDVFLQDAITATDVPTLAPRDLPFQPKLDARATAEAAVAMGRRLNVDLGTPRQFQGQLDAVKGAAVADGVLAKRLKDDFRTDRKELLPPLDRHAAAKMRDNFARRYLIENTFNAARPEGPDRPRVSNSLRHAAVAIAVDADSGRNERRQLDRRAIGRGPSLDHDEAVRTATNAGRSAPGLHEAVERAYEAHTPETPGTPGEEN